MILLAAVANPSAPERATPPIVAQGSAHAVILPAVMIRQAKADARIPTPDVVRLHLPLDKDGVIVIN